MYVSEAMITACEDMQKNANEMESQIKDMMEMEGRNHGIELDKRKSARDLWNELNEHMSADMPAGEGQMQDHMPSEYEPASDPLLHTHEDGMEHSHEGGDMEHHHHDDGTMHDHEGGDMEHHHHDDGTMHDHEGGDTPHTHEETKE